MWNGCYVLCFRAQVHFGGEQQFAQHLLLTDHERFFLDDHATIQQLPRTDRLDGTGPEAGAGEAARATRVGQD